MSEPDGPPTIPKDEQSYESNRNEKPNDSEDRKSGASTRSYDDGLNDQQEARPSNAQADSETDSEQLLSADWMQLSSQDRDMKRTSKIKEKKETPDVLHAEESNEDHKRVRRSSRTPRSTRTVDRKDPSTSVYKESSSMSSEDQGGGPYSSKKSVRNTLDFAGPSQTKTKEEEKKRNREIKQAIRESQKRNQQEKLRNRLLRESFDKLYPLPLSNFNLENRIDLQSPKDRPNLAKLMDVQYKWSNERYSKYNLLKQKFLEIPHSEKEDTSLRYIQKFVKSFHSAQGGIDVPAELAHLFPEYKKAQANAAKDSAKSELRLNCIVAFVCDAYDDKGDLKAASHEKRSAKKPRSSAKCSVLSEEEVIWNLGRLVDIRKDCCDVIRVASNDMVTSGKEVDYEKDLENDDDFSDDKTGTSKRTTRSYALRQRKRPKVDMLSQSTCKQDIPVSVCKVPLDCIVYLAESLESWKSQLQSCFDHVQVSHKMTKSKSAKNGKSLGNATKEVSTTISNPIVIKPIWKLKVDDLAYAWDSRSSTWYACRVLDPKFPMIQVHFLSKKLKPIVQRIPGIAVFPAKARVAIGES